MVTRKDAERAFLAAVSGCELFMADLEAGAIQDATYTLLKVLACDAGVKKELTLSHMLQIIMRSDYTELKSAIQIYRNTLRLKRHAYKNIKRTFVTELNLRGDPQPYTAMGVKVIKRNRGYFEDVKSRCSLVDIENRDLSQAPGGCHIIDPSDGWYTVDSDEEGVFVDDRGEIQLVVLRNVTRMEGLLDNVNEVIDEAISDRRNVRPTHDGSMVQAGFNAGPRHCRVWGYVNNFKNATKLTDDVKAGKDRHVLGVMALAWHIFRSRAPREIVESVCDSIQQSDLPEMGAKFDQDRDAYTARSEKPTLGAKFGEDPKGYSIEFLNHTLHFPCETRAPCEGYLVSDYAAPVHTDKTYANYSFSWFTRHNNTKPGIPMPGGNYIDVSLGVRVISAQDTLLIFRPAYKHGTTKFVPCLSRSGIVITFSQRIADVYAHTVAKLQGDKLCDIESIENEI